MPKLAHSLFSILSRSEHSYPLLKSADAELLQLLKSAFIWTFLGERHRFESWLKIR